jgi:hypothetical protein
MFFNTVVTLLPIDDRRRYVIIADAEEAPDLDTGGLLYPPHAQLHTH